MAKFIIDLTLDGYDSEEEMIKACEEFIYENLNCTASSVKIKKIDEEIIEKINNLPPGSWPVPSYKPLKFIEGKVPN